MKLLVRASDWRAGATVCFLLATGITHAQSSAVTAQQFEQSKILAETLLSQRKSLDSLLWAPEELAQKYESRFTVLWDNLLRREDERFAILGAFPFTTLVLGQHQSSEALDLNIARYRFARGGARVSPEEWRTFLTGAERDGYQIVHSEWHHQHFVPPAGGSGAYSEIGVVLHVAREAPAHRVIIRGVLGVSWAADLDAAGNPVPETIGVEELEILERSRPAAFTEVFRVSSNDSKPRILPLVVYDLNGDGLSEVVVGGQNLVVWNRGEGKFEVEPFLDDERSIFDGAVLADFTGDGNVDFVAVDTSGYPILFEGDADGRFPKPGRKMADTHLQLPKAFTAGDIDDDGDLDLYIANYKYAYRQGQMPTPYYDANDGFPAYLLRNDGDGVFTDITESAGVAAKRFRRAYSSSLVDLDEDRDLDLLVVSDYAGFDTYLNDGKGHFEDISDSFGSDRHFFGMGHTFGDYDQDGRLDFYVIGMSSTTSKRLEGLGLGRADKPEHTAMRAAMGYGNRMFLRRDDGFVRAPFNDKVARTGWSWGASSFDFDNDGDRDIFVANGHYSGKSTQDYCTTFWRHDIYTDGSDPNLARDIMFQEQSTDLRQADISWNGYEHKVLMMNRDGEDFVNIAFLMGVAFEYDGRGVVAEDLDGDGRVDLMVVEFKTEGLNRDSFVLHVYQNRIEQAGHWIGVRLRDPGGWSPIGATVTIETENGVQTAQLVTGDSFSSQHPAAAHFGLGAAASSTVKAIQVTWRDGTVQRIENPTIDQYHWAEPPAASVSLRSVRQSKPEGG